MPKLDTTGDLAAAAIAFYGNFDILLTPNPLTNISTVPIAILTFALTLRYGFSRDAGWIFLFVFSIGKYAVGF